MGYQVLLVKNQTTGDKMTYPFTATRQWGYLDYTEKEAIDLLKDYFKNADKIKISYNNKIIYEKI